MSADSSDPSVGHAAVSPRRGLLRNRNYGLYLAGNIAGWGGLAIADVMFLFIVFSQTGSALAVAYVGLVEAVPPIALGLVAGVLADRYDRRAVLAVTSLLQAGVLAVVLAYLWRFGFHLVIVLVLVFALETVTVLFRPASNALLPELVASSDLEDANGLQQASTSVASTIGAAAAALVLVLAGTIPTVLLDTLILLVGGLLFAAIVGRFRQVAPAPAAAEPSVRRELREAVRYLGEHPPLVQLTAVAVVSGFFVEMFSPFLVVYTVRVLGEAGSTFGYLLAGFSAGFFIGSLVVGRIGILPEYRALLRRGPGPERPPPLRAGARAGLRGRPGGPHGDRPAARPRRDRLHHPRAACRPPGAPRPVSGARRDPDVGRRAPGDPRRRPRRPAGRRSGGVRGGRPRPHRDRRRRARAARHAIDSAWKRRPRRRSCRPGCSGRSSCP